MECTQNEAAKADYNRVIEQLSSDQQNGSVSSNGADHDTTINNQA